MRKHIRFLIAPIAIWILPLIVSAQLVMTNNFYMVMSGGTKASPTAMVITTPTSAGITNKGTGWIVSENEFNQVQWNIGTNTGSYVVPFGYSNTDYLPVTFNIIIPGSSGNGAVKFSTYHCPTWDNLLYEPSDVVNMLDFGAPNYSNNMVDRFWIVDAGAYSVKPTASTTYTYIRSGSNSEIVNPNYIVESDLIAQRFDTTLKTWNDFLGVTGSDITNGNTGTVSSGGVSLNNFFRSWTLANDSNQITAIIPITSSLGLTIYPNPTTKTLYVKFSGQDGDAFISIMDMIGRELTKQREYISQGTLPIDVSTLPAAMYFIRVNTDKFITTAKFIKE
jgi:hypothetical protein